MAVCTHRLELASVTEMAAALVQTHKWSVSTHGPGSFATSSDLQPAEQRTYSPSERHFREPPIPASTGL